MKINASDILNAQKFKKEMSVEDFSKTKEFKKLEKNVKDLYICNVKPLSYYNIISDEVDNDLALFVWTSEFCAK